MKGSIIDTIIPINNCKNINSHYVKAQLKKHLVPPQYHSKADEADALGEAQYYAMHPDLKH